MSGHSATTEDFQKLDIRVGRVSDVQPFLEGRYSTHILMIDFGPELGTKKSLAKHTELRRTGTDRQASSRRHKLPTEADRQAPVRGTDARRAG